MIPEREPAFRQVDPNLEDALATFLGDLATAGVDDAFHPHPLTPAAAAQLAHYQGMDYYVVLVDGNDVLVYGMLRGWDEGYVIPSLGIAASPRHSGQGWGRRMMEHLHDVARQRGASQVRLTVYKSNWNAVGLYRSLGYVFHDIDDKRLLGLVNL